MIHHKIATLLTQIHNSSNILYILIIFIAAYLVLGLSAGLLFAVTISLKEICVLSPVTKIKDKILGVITVIFFWPFAITRIYDLWYNFCIFISCLFSGSTFRRNIMNNKNVSQLRYLVNTSKGELSFKKLATTNMGCIEESILSGEQKGNTFVTIYGLEEKPISQIVPTGISFCSTTTLDFLKELKTNGLVGLKRVGAEKEIKFDFSTESKPLKEFSLVFPEEVFCYIFQDISTVYVTKAMELDEEKTDSIENPSLMEFKNQLLHEVHINQDNILFMVDYNNHEAYALDSETNEIMNCEYEGNDPEDHFTRVRIGEDILKYQYNELGYLDKISVERSTKSPKYGYYLKVDEVDDTSIRKKSQHLTITYVVPYLKDTGNVFVYSEDRRIYRTDDIYLEKDKILEWNIEYRVLSDEEEEELNDAFAKTLKNGDIITD